MLDATEVVPLVVFSAHAEVVPKIVGKSIPSQCILRARGGSSPDGKIGDIPTLYSPRTRR